MARVLVLLAHSREFPNGDVTQGFELSVRLTTGARLDAHAWMTAPDRWTVRHFRGDATERSGVLIRREDDWAICFGADEAPLVVQAGQPIRPGEYLSIRDRKGEARIYRVVQVQPGRVPAATT